MKTIFWWQHGLKVQENRWFYCYPIFICIFLNNVLIWTWHLPIFFPQTNINTLKFYIVCLMCFCPELPVLTVLKINGKVPLSIYLWFTLWIIKMCSSITCFFLFFFLTEMDKTESGNFLSLIKNIPTEPWACIFKLAS